MHGACIADLHVGRGVNPRNIANDCPTALIKRKQCLEAREGRGGLRAGWTSLVVLKHLGRAQGAIVDSDQVIGAEPWPVAGKHIAQGQMIALVPCHKGAPPGGFGLFDAVDIDPGRTGCVASEHDVLQPRLGNARPRLDLRFARAGRRAGS